MNICVVFLLIVLLQSYLTVNFLRQAENTTYRFSFLSPLGVGAASPKPRGL